MVQLSQNGWPVLTTAPPLHKIDGTNIELRIRPGDVTTVLGDLASRFHLHVEKLDLPGLKDEWGWAVRTVRGSTKVISNHASGTAIDLNATRHPRGVPGTFNDQKRRAIRTILASYMDKDTHRSVVRWGEDFSTTVDSMHFEIVGGADAVARVAKRLRAKFEEDNMPTSAEIAKAVLNADVIVNKSAPKDSRNPTWSLSSMISDIEDTQDGHTKELRDIHAKVDAITKQLATISSLLANKSIPTPRTGA